MSRPSQEQLVRGLRTWTTDHDLHVQAAIELLIGHGVWLRRAEFMHTCVRRSSGSACWIDWQAARKAFDAGELHDASSTEVAVLDFAIALGEDRYRFDHMGAANTRLLLAAASHALGGVR